MVVDEQVEDKLLCLLTGSEQFSVSECINQFRARHPKKDWMDMVWNKITPFRVNAFLWKVFRGALPVDNNIQSR